MGMLDGVIEQLEKNPAVVKTMQDITSGKDAIIRTANRFDERFNTAEKLAVETAKAVLGLAVVVNRIELMLDRCEGILTGKDAAPAGEHVLALPENVPVAECGLVGCKEPGIHEHGDGIPVRVSGYRKSFEAAEIVDQVLKPVAVVHESEIVSGWASSQPPESTM